MEKDNILGNIEEYTAEDLLPFVQQGVVSFEELCTDTDGHFSPRVRKELQQLLATNEEKDWQDAQRRRSIESIECYLKSYPEGTHREEARILLKEIELKTQQDLLSSIWKKVNKSSKDDLQGFIENYPEHEHAQEAIRLLNSLKNKPHHKPGIRKMFREIDNLRFDESVVSVLDKAVEIIKDYIDNKRICREQLIETINIDPNVLSSQVIRQLIHDQYLGAV